MSPYTLSFTSGVEAGGTGKGAVSATNGVGPRWGGRGGARSYREWGTAGGKRRSSTGSTSLIAVLILRSKSLFPRHA